MPTPYNLAVADHCGQCPMRKSHAFCDMADEPLEALDSIRFTAGYPKGALLFVEGHQIYAKNICDALNEMRFEPAPTARGGSVSIFPVFFSVAGAKSRDSIRAEFTNTQMTIRRKLAIVRCAWSRPRAAIRAPREVAPGCRKSRIFR